MSPSSEKPSRRKRMESHGRMDVPRPELPASGTNLEIDTADLVGPIASQINARPYMDRPGTPERSGYVAAADIGGTRLRMVLADIKGNVVVKWSIILGSRQKSPKSICALIAKGLQAMCVQGDIRMGTILHLTAGAPGITNVTDGIVIAAPNLTRWNNVPLRAMLETHTAIRCTVENDTNLAALGEHWRGSVRGVDNFVFIALGTGVGAGIFLRGNLHQGANWSAGEIGYFGVSGKGRRPIRLRETGQLENLIGGGAIEEEWQRVLQGSTLTSSSGLETLKATEIFDRAAHGDPRALSVLQRIARALADAIADICLLLNPEIVVLGGGVGSHRVLRVFTENRLRQHDATQLELRSSELGTEAQLFGGIFLALQAVSEQYLQADG